MYTTGPRSARKKILFRSTLTKIIFPHIQRIRGIILKLKYLGKIDFLFELFQGVAQRTRWKMRKRGQLSNASVPLGTHVESAYRDFNTRTSIKRKLIIILGISDKIVKSWSPGLKSTFGVALSCHISKSNWLVFLYLSWRIFPDISSRVFPFLSWWVFL